jgi:hypothetical protein
MMLFSIPQHRCAINIQENFRNYVNSRIKRVLSRCNLSEFFLATFLNASTIDDSSCTVSCSNALSGTGFAEVSECAAKRRRNQIVFPHGLENLLPVDQGFLLSAQINRDSEGKAYAIHGIF